MLEFYNTRYPKAMKQYKCEFCGKIIEKGERYFYYAGKYDGRFFTTKYCLICEKITSEYCSEVDNEYDEDEVREWLHDKYCHGCKHSGNGEDDCEVTELSCSIIREKYKEGIENDNNGTD